MEIKISTQNFDEILNKSVVRWRLGYRKHYFFFAIYAIFGISVLAIHAIIAKNASEFWDIISSVGIAFLILSFIQIRSTYRLRKRFLARTRQMILTHKKTGQPIEHVFSDEMMTYRDFESYYELKWSSFPNYLVDNGYLFLTINGSILNSFVFHQSEMTTGEFEELHNFCQKNLSLIKK